MQYYSQKKSWLICLSILFFSGLVNAQKAVLIEEQGQAVLPLIESTKATSKSGSFVSPGQKGESVAQFVDAVDLRAHRRVGAGGVFAGGAGVLGLQLELNYSTTDAAVIGFGGGGGFNSVGLEWKHIFGGTNLSPFVSMGYSRWSSNSKQKRSIDKTSPSYLGARFLTEREKETGQFAVDLITPTAGLQYNLLSGESVGTSIFVEVVFLTRIQDFVNSPTGGFGAIYYF